mmetsp:Transcript_127790/g.355620  ORF Transcript_127790/g.355620 Transcript_127790/m.355620 type:complete len:90 (+) Transcript_127790:80-349(+)
MLGPMQATATSSILTQPASAVLIRAHEPMQPVLLNIIARSSLNTVSLAMTLVETCLQVMRLLSLVVTVHAALLPLRLPDIPLAEMQLQV